MWLRPADRQRAQLQWRCQFVVHRIAANTAAYTVCNLDYFARIIETFYLQKGIVPSSNLRLHNCANADHVRFAAEVEWNFK